MTTYFGSFFDDKIDPSGISAFVTPQAPLPGVAADSLFGFGGNDMLGGGGGPDTLNGGLGRDMLTGGPGSDTFVYTSVFDSLPSSATRDVILDFTPGVDKINLDLIDANPFIFFDQDFTLLPEAGFVSFTAPGQMHFDTSTHVLSGNIDFLPSADFEIELPSVLAGTLMQSDFIG